MRTIPPAASSRRYSRIGPARRSGRRSPAVGMALLPAWDNPPTRLPGTPASLYPAGPGRLRWGSLGPGAAGPLGPGGGWRGAWGGVVRAPCRNLARWVGAVWAHAGTWHLRRGRSLAHLCPWRLTRPGSVAADRGRGS